MGEVSGLLGMGLGILSVVGGLGIVFYALWVRSKDREMRHRERMAMIDRGLVPSSAVVEAGPLDRDHVVRRRRANGILMICIGIGLMVMLGISRGEWTGVGVGAFVAMFGVGALISAVLDDRDRRATRRSTSPGEGPGTSVL